MQEKCMMKDERWGSRQSPGRSQIGKGLVWFRKVFGFYFMGRERSHCSMIRFSFRKDDESSRRIVAEG